MTKMNVGMTFVQMKFRRDFMNVVTASVNEVLTWFHGKDEYCHGFDMDEV